MVTSFCENASGGPYLGSGFRLAIDQQNVESSEGRTDWRTDGRINERTKEEKNERTYERMDGRKEGG